MKQHRTRFKHFKTDQGAKVSVALSKTPEGYKGIMIRMQKLSDIPLDGWEPVKTFKDMVLYRTDSHFLEKTFLNIVHTLNEFVIEE